MDRHRSFEAINSRHRVRRAFFCNEESFRKQFDVDVPIGLCAGLVQVWWSEISNGNDGIKCIHEASPSLVRRVVLSQLMSVYLRELPHDDSHLQVSEAAQLRFKYGDYRIAGIKDLQKTFDVESLLELDLILHYGLPIRRKWQCSHSIVEIVTDLREYAQPGLYLLLIRFWDSKRVNGEKGHRTALVIEEGGICRFYDSRWGEISFVHVDDFADWFIDYWQTQRWDFFLQRGVPPSAPLRIFGFGGTLSQSAMAKYQELGSRRLDPKIDIDDLKLWLTESAVIPFARVIADTGELLV